MYYEIFEKLCDERGVKPAQVSKGTGISTATLSSWKKGKYTPKSDKLQLIADYFGVSLDYLKSGEEPYWEELFFDEMYFEAYLKCIGWNTAQEENGTYTISNGSVSVNITSENFSKFESEIRNRCNEVIMSFISTSVEETKPRDDDIKSAAFVS